MSHEEKRERKSGNKGTKGWIALGGEKELNLGGAAMITIYDVSQTSHPESF